MGKCILAGHPPLGGIGCGTYMGNGAEQQTIALGVTPKWVFVLSMGYKLDGEGSYSSHGGLAILGYPAGDRALPSVEIVPNGFKVRHSSTNYIYTNYNNRIFHYIYGT